MEKRKYELTVVFEGQLEQDVVEKHAEQINNLIKTSKSEVIKQDHLGKRRLAYEIMRKQYGHYVYYLFESDGSNIKDIEDNLKLNESVLRYLTVRLDKKAIEYIDQKEAKDTPPETDNEKIVEKEK